VKRYQSILTGILLSILVISASISFLVVGQEEEEEEVWDFDGIMRISSDEERIVIYDPADHGLNESVGGYTRPPLYFQILGLDTNDDEELDRYYGFYGIYHFELSDFYNYTTAALSLFWIRVNALWQLRIPEGSSAKWEVLYYPDPLYNSMIKNLLYKIPIYYVNLTKYTGINLEYRIDLGLNYTTGNFTTFGSGGEPLIPSMPTFPEYNVGVPLFTDNLPLEILQEASFFSDTISFIAIIGLSFMFFYIIRRRRKRAG